MLMKSVLFWDLTQRKRVAIPYRRFGITYRFRLLESSSSYCLILKNGTDRFPETSVWNYQSFTLRKISEDLGSHADVLGRSLSHHRSWPLQLPVHCVNVCCAKMSLSQAMGGCRVSVDVRLYVTQCFL